MRNLVYVAPFPMATTMKFAAALASLENVRLIGVFRRPPVGPAARIFKDIALVEDLLSVSGLESALSKIIKKYGPVYRLLGILENLQEQLAVLRLKFRIPGMGPKIARRFRDKAEMKEVLLRAGIPCARHRKVQTLKQAWDFLETVGFPVVLKPPAGAGCKSTYRVSDPAGLVKAFNEIPTRPVLVEEFLTGFEHSMEAFTLNGKPLFSSFSRYYPSPLEVMQKPWIQWVVLFPKEVDSPVFQRARSAGFSAIRAMGLNTAMTHMEWFSRPDGSVSIGEIGARPPGAHFSDVTGLVHGFNTHRVWARLMVDGVYEGPWNRKTAAAIAFLRGKGSGEITRVTGLEAAQKKMGSLVVSAKLPKVGALRSSSYEGDGWVIIQDPDTEKVKHAALELITTVQVHYAGK